MQNLVWSSSAGNYLLGNYKIGRIGQENGLSKCGLLNLVAVLQQLPKHEDTVKLIKLLRQTQCLQYTLIESFQKQFI